MIEVCFAIHDETGNYIINMAVAMKSVINNVSDKVRFHIMHDNSISIEQKGELSEICRSGIDDIEFYFVEIPDSWKQLNNLKKYTEASLFRLLMTKVLPEEISKCIYLDADIIVNIDISELWEIDFEDHLIMGCADIERRYSTINRKFLSYINSGVLVFNLDEIRKSMDMPSEAGEYMINNNSVFNDQDAINYIFSGRIKIIDQKFNIYTKRELLVESKVLKKAIYHFAADYPRLEGIRAVDRLYWDIFHMTSWGDTYNKLISYVYEVEKNKARKTEIMRNNCVAIGGRKRICFWGAILSEQYKWFRRSIGLQDKEIMFVDKDTTKVDVTLDGCNVYTVDSLENKENDTYIIILAYNSIEEISSQLEKWGYQKYYDYCDIRELLIDTEVCLL